MMLAIRPLSTHVGAEISGLDLRAQIDEATAAELRAALRKHHLILLRQPRFDEDDQIRFSRLFGKVLIRNSYDGNAGKEAYYISNDRPDGVLPIGEIEFHHDHIFYAEPLKFAFLYAIDVPKSGSATRFRSSRALLESLPANLRHQAEAVRCLHFFNYDDNYSGRQDSTKDSPRAQRAWQPLVWTNPETSEKAMWLARISTVDYEGIGKAEGERLLDRLWNFAEQQTDLSYTHPWQTSDLIVWDNRMLAHARLPFQSHEPRTLRRTSAI
jgi:taurine dioxygenase